MVRPNWSAWAHGGLRNASQVLLLKLSGILCLVCKFPRLRKMGDVEHLIEQDCDFDYAVVR